ncbi:hypothetical protein QZH41_006585 [Actinostola sp. cb2023]|nr:hypothetical protein QZH41_006585 [Actinostola sp. cb2023]
MADLGKKVQTKNGHRLFEREQSASSELTSEDLEAAKIVWYKESQSEVDNNERLKKSLESLGVFKDDSGVLRCKGRQEVKNVLSKCVVCKKVIGKACEGPPAPPLPQFRVSDDPAFSKIGVDYAGPLFVKNIYGKGTEMNKCYVALFTCGSTRAIHLELTPDLCATSFMRVLKRFIGRRGLPSFVISDNGTTFRDSRIQRYVATIGIVWKFNVPAASWWGGFFEICVKLMKKCLRKVLGTAKLRYEELETVLVEIEGVLNSRPLTYVYDELTESPLTPSCLVVGRRLLDQSSSSENVPNNDAASLGKRARYLESVINHYRRRWRSEYLTGIREYQRLSVEKSRRMLKVGDIVHIQEKPRPRLQWRMGKVERLLPGRDNVVRAAEVITLDKSKRIIRVKRPLQKLYPLEVSAQEETSEADVGSDVPQNIPQIQLIRDEDIPVVAIGH